MQHKDRWALGQGWMIFFSFEKYFKGNLIKGDVKNQP